MMRMCYGRMDEYKTAAADDLGVPALLSYAEAEPFPKLRSPAMYVPSPIPRNT